jgi:hypothetical protein
MFQYPARMSCLTVEHSAVTCPHPLHSVRSIDSPRLPSLPLLHQLSNHFWLAASAAETGFATVSFLAFTTPANRADSGAAALKWKMDLLHVNLQLSISLSPLLSSLSSTTFLLFEHLCWRPLSITIISSSAPVLIASYPSPLPLLSLRSAITLALTLPLLASRAHGSKTYRRGLPPNSGRELLDTRAHEEDRIQQTKDKASTRYKQN